MKYSFLFLLLFFPLALNAADPYNALRWNRANHEAGNSKIDTGPWFEWWYYKVVVPDSPDAFYFSYGVVNPWDTKKTNSASHSFVNFGSFSEKEMFSSRFDINDFQASYEETNIQIADNSATDKHLKGILTSATGKAEWDVTLTKDWAFNAMGWAMSMSKISNIFWYPAQAGAKMSGTIELNGKKYTLDQAPAYQDRNWGRSFSEWWTWIVSNHFPGHPGTILACGGGKPKILGTTPEGVNIGLKHLGKEYVFRVNDFDKIKADIHFGKWEVTAENRRNQKIEISAFAPKSEFLPLKFPTPEGKMYWDYEALKGNIKVNLYERAPFSSEWKKIVTLETNEGGIEYGSFHSQDFEDIFDSSLHLL